MLVAGYIKSTSIDHRKHYGQYFTPPLVAELMAQWVLSCRPQTILDPAFGLGVFYDEAFKNKSETIKFIGYELDKNILSYFQSDRNPSNLTLINGDYLAAKPQKYDAIICNPPYLKFQKFWNRHDILPAIEQQIGQKLAGYSNISSVFLVKALSELAENGNLAFVMPFEFFNAGYGREIKRYLMENDLLKQIILFAQEKEVFPEVTTTVCVLFCKNNRQRERIKITKIDTDLQKLPVIENYYQALIEPSKLPYHKKWSSIILSLFSNRLIPIGFIRLSAYGSFTRGIATGANHFFALSKTKLLRLELGENNIRKCLTKSRQIRKLVLTEADFHQLYDSDKPVYCLDISEHQNRAVKKYIQTGEQLGYHQRYLSRMRTPWYKIEVRLPAPILFGVFHRERLKVVRNFSDAVNFTCFHSFYPNQLGEGLLNQLFVYFISAAGQEIIKMNQRVYGDNLYKFEPGDLNESWCPNPTQLALIDQKEAKQVIEIAKVNAERAIQLSNSLVQRMFQP